MWRGGDHQWARGKLPRTRTNIGVIQELNSDLPVHAEDLV